MPGGNRKESGAELLLKQLDLLNSPFEDKEVKQTSVGICFDIVHTVYDLPSSMSLISKRELVEKYGVDQKSLNSFPCEHLALLLVKHPPDSAELGNRAALVICPKNKGNCEVVGSFYLLELTDAIINAKFQAASFLLKLGLKTGLGFVKIGRKETN